MKTLQIITIILVCRIGFTFSQDTIKMVTGKQILTNSYTMDNFNRELCFKNKKGRKRKLYLDNIFSVVDSDGFEKVIYNPESNNIYKYSIDEMKDYRQGGYDASRYYKTPLSTFFGFIAGAGSTILMQNPVYAMFPAGGISVIIGLPNKSRKNIIKNHSKYADNDYYVLGYNQEAKNKRFINSVKGASGGIVAGVIVIILQFNGILPQITIN